MSVAYKGLIYHAGVYCLSETYVRTFTKLLTEFLSFFLLLQLVIFATEVHLWDKIKVPHGPYYGMT